MIVSDAVEQYVARKRQMGRKYENTSKVLRAFARSNNVPLAKISRLSVLIFLNKQPLARDTWIAYYRLLRTFFNYWLSLREIKRLPMPRARKNLRRVFAPYIFTRTEIRSILRTAPEVQNRTLSEISPETFRLMVLLLYATGMWVGEAMALRSSDIDLDRRLIRVSSRVGADRTIPVSADLTELIRRHIGKTKQELVLTKRDGRRILTHRAAVHFRRVRKIAGIQRNDGAKFAPALRDLRHTFAVHRISAWYDHKANIELMLPRLATYMGLWTTTITEHYLPLTPQHFSRELDTLSMGIAKS